MRRLTAVLLGGVMLGAAAEARQMDVFAHAAVMESLRTVPPKFREYWLRERGLEDWLSPAQPASPESIGLSLVGKWGRGPSVEVTGQDTLVALTLGSEVALLSFADPDHPRVLSEVQFPKIMGQSQLVGNRLYASGNGVFEVWDITDATNPVQLGSQPWGIGDFQVNDTLLYFILRDTFRVYSVSDPANLVPVASYRDSGWFLAASESLAVLGHNGGLRFVDISDPRNPHRVGSFSGELARSAQVRGNLCCATLESGTVPYPIRFVTLDLTDPASPRQLASLADAGGYDLYLDDSLAFASGRKYSGERFQVIGIADSSAPVSIGQCYISEDKFGVWASLTSARAFVASRYNGLSVVDIAALSNPVLDTSLLGAGSSIDLALDGDLCYVANEGGGLKVINISDPLRPTQAGELDTAGVIEACYSVAARDSFAFISWFRAPGFRTVDVSNPTSPRVAATCGTLNYAEDMVLRDTFVYCAEDNIFQVVNVARPREPRVVGTVNLPDWAYKVALVDTLAYVADLTSLQVLSVAQPTNPRIIGQWDHRTTGFEIVGDLLYAAGFEQLYSLDISNPASPQLLDSVVLQRVMFDVAVIDTIAYVGGWTMRAVSVADPMNLTVLDYLWVPPTQYIRRLVHYPPYVYVCATDGGVCIMEQAPAGISEERPGGDDVRAMRVWPSVTRGRVSVGGNPGPWRLLDVTGKVVAEGSATGADIDLSRLAPGVYFVGPASSVGRDASGVTRVTVVR